MTVDSENDSKNASASKLSVALRIALGLICCMLVILSLSMGAVSIANWMKLPEVIGLLFVVLGAAIALFLGGAVARWVAGPSVLPGWMGIICVVVFLGIIFLNPHVLHVAKPEIDLVKAGSPENSATMPIMVRDNTLTFLFRAVVVILGAALAWLGDKYAARTKKKQ